MSSNIQSFISNKGVITTDIGRGFDFANKIIVQPDGKFIVVGSTQTPYGYNTVIAKYKGDGALDNSFGNNGIISSKFDGSINTDLFKDYFSAFDIVLQLDEKILVLSTSALTRYNSNGTIDSTFGKNGFIDAFGSHSIKLQPDGKILKTSTNSGLTRLNADGSLDTTFVNSYGNDFIHYKPNGTIDNSYGKDSNGKLIHFNLDGTIDTAYKAINLPQGQRSYWGMDVQEDGKILVVGRSTWPFTGDPVFGLVRYLKDGNLDPLFGSNGQVLTPLRKIDSFGATAYDVKSLSDGSILVGGNGGGIFALAKYTKNGFLDTSFGTNGIAVDYSDGWGSFDDTLIHRTNFVVQHDGKILISGMNTHGIQLARYDANGILDDSFGLKGLIKIDKTSIYSASVSLSTNGEIYIVGPTELRDAFKVSKFYMNGSLVDGNGDDYFYYSNGIDNINGQAGLDTVLYPKDTSSYTIHRNGNNFVVTDKNSANEIDTISNVEHLKFADMNVNLLVQGIAAAAPQADVTRLMELYVAFFNRVPDADGLAYWIGEIKAGQSIDQIATSFYNAGVHFSSVTGFTPNMSNQAFVNVIYKNVLGRSDGGDQEGVAYWSNELATGSSSRGKLVSTMLNSAHSFKGDATWGWVADLLDNKIFVAKTVAIDLGLNYNTSEASITNGVAIASLVTSVDVGMALKRIGIATSDIVLIPNATPSAVTVSVTSAGSSNAAQSNTIYSVTPGNYVFNIDQFSAGDQIHFSTGTAISITNDSFTDGAIDIYGSLNGQTVKIHLTGLPTPDDIFSGMTSFNSAFGAGSLT